MDMNIKLVFLCWYWAVGQATDSNGVFIAGLCVLRNPGTKISRAKPLVTDEGFKINFIGKLVMLKTNGHF